MDEDDSRQALWKLDEIIELLRQILEQLQANNDQE